LSATVFEFHTLGRKNHSNSAVDHFDPADHAVAHERYMTNIFRDSIMPFGQ